MSGAGHSTNDFWQNRQNPASRIFEAASDFWIEGMEVWRSALGAGDSGAANPFTAMMGAAWPMPPGGPDPASALSGALGGWQNAASQAADMAQPMARAWMAAAASGGRYWTTLAELHARYQGGLMRAVASRASGQAAVPASECRELADELRAWLREIGDAATREARRLQAELDAIGEEIAEAADAATPAATATGTDPRPRRHRVKP